MELCGKQWTNKRALAKVRGRSIRSLNLYDTSVDDDFLSEVSAAGSLHSLHVSSDLITDAGVMSVLQNCRMTSLLLDGVPKVTDHAIEAIVACKSITELYLAGTAITDQSFGLLKQLPHVRALVIGNTAITDDGIRALASKTVDLVSFENCQIQGEGFCTWKHDGKMSFYGRGSSLNDKGFAAACRSFPRMWNLIISETDVGDDGVKALAGQDPTSLKVDGSKISPMGVRWIIDNLRVHGLEVDESQISPEDAARYPNPDRPDLWIRVHEKKGQR
jgi:hypothetical protein